MSKSKSVRTPRALTREDLLHIGSLITYHDQGVERCLGYLLSFPDRGTFDAHWGALALTADEAEAHNRALSAAELTGLDDNCQVGQGALFYVTLNADRIKQVTTFIGTVIAPSVIETPGGYRFTRKGKTFSGRKEKDADSVFFKRTA